MKPTEEQRQAILAEREAIQKIPQELRQAILAEHAARIATLGGRARALAMSPERRSAQARKAVLARWKKRDATAGIDPAKPDDVI